MLVEYDEDDNDNDNDGGGCPRNVFYPRSRSSHPTNTLIGDGDSHSLLRLVTFFALLAPNLPLPNTSLLES